MRRVAAHALIVPAVMILSTERHSVFFRHNFVVRASF